MKKYIYTILLGVLACLGMASCSNDEPNDPTIFPTDEVKYDQLDTWLLKNYTNPYNVEFQYKMKDIESNMTYNLVPADSAKAAKLAIIVKYLWFDAYSETVGNTFIKENVPRVIMLVGSPAYNSNGTFVLGTAEGGLKVTLYMVNSLTDEMLKNYTNLNDYYFHTMHHEFTHILTQKIAYDTSFNKVSDGSYISGDWYSLSDTQARKKGFVTAYAMSEANEDFAEMLSVYVTSSEATWQQILDTAGNTLVASNMTAAQAITAKMNLVKSYMLSSWQLDLDKLREAVLHRANELPSLDLEHLK